MEIGAWNLPLTSVLSPCPRGEAERPGRLQRSRVDAQTVEVGGERAGVSGPTVWLIPVLRSVVLVIQTAPREDNEQQCRRSIAERKSQIPVQKAMVYYLGSQQGTVATGSRLGTHPSMRALIRSRSSAIFRWES
jgi:hypothetical protein